MMALLSSDAARPCARRIAWSATSHGCSLISAVTAPLTSRPTMMVRPEKEANVATTSWMSVAANVVVIFGAVAARATGSARVGSTRVCSARTGSWPGATRSARSARSTRSTR